LTLSVAIVIVSVHADEPMNTVLDRLKALADATRLRILALLSREELSVGELCAILGLTQSRASGHLGVLRDAGLVRDRRQGTSVFYSLPVSGAGVEALRAARSLEGAFTLGEREEKGLAEALRRRTERSREFFDRAAGAWGEGRSEALGLHAGGLAVAGLLPRGLTVLDLGTGTGALLPMLGRYVERVVAVDGSRGMLARARENLDPESPIRLLRADLERLPVGDGGVDGVVANMVLHHLHRPETILREMARVLHPEGRGVIVDFETHEERWLLEEEGHRWPGFDPAQLASWCVDAGLTVPAFERVPTPRTGRWSRLVVFAARFGRAVSTGNGGGRRLPRRKS
jgi:ArsR family transcriptional regulator